MAQLDVTELDFDNIKQSLKTFLSAQSEFSDYDFEGSALAVLLDTLAYNTHYNAMLAHMLANESFLDSAIKRSSVTSIAKSLGYTPRSSRASTASVKFTVVPDSSYQNSTLTLSRDTTFTAKNREDNVTYTFYPSETVTASLETTNGVTGFVFTDLKLKEGTRVSNNFLIDANNVSGPLTIPNAGVDTTTIRVRVQKSATDLTVESYNLANSLLDVSSTTKSYFLEETLDGLYTIRFGDDVIGKKLTAGNVVIVDYITTKGAAANGSKGFACTTTLTGAGESRTFDSASTIAASGGQGKEGIDSIRRNAPIYNQTRERAVAASDYESLILASNSNIQAVSVWGGEDNVPPIYGKVFISLDPIEGQIITQRDKDEILSTVIGPKSAISIIPEFVDPDYSFIGLKVGVVYDNKKTTLTSGQVSDSVSSAITNFFATELNTLNKNFYYSKIHDAIKAISTSVVSVNITPTIQKRLTVDLGKANTYDIFFNSKLQPREMTSSFFNATVSGANIKVKFQDVPSATVLAPEYSGTGVVNIVDANGGVIETVGTIDYSTGRVQITSVIIASLLETETKIRLRVRPHDDSKDILTNILSRTAETSTGPVFATASNNTILTLDDTAKSITLNTRAGLDINITTLDEKY